MIKGVNRQILEVVNPENEYFERVIFFVKPEYSNLEDGKLNFEATMYSKGSGKPPRIKRKKLDRLFGCCKLLASGVAGALIMSFIMNTFV